MTEALHAVIQYAFTDLHASELKIVHAAGNYRTRSVMDRAGFIEQAFIPNAHDLPNGSKVGEFILKMTQDHYLNLLASRNN